MSLQIARMAHGALAGAAAAGVWAVQQPLDRRVFGSRYDDVELLGRIVAPRAGRARWYPVGLAMHVGNGAVFGGAYAVVAPRVLGAAPEPARGPIAALAEHVGLWPLGRVSDRFHPAREELPRLTGNRRAFWQATWRHLLFGVALGELERRWNRDPAP